MCVRAQSCGDGIQQSGDTPAHAAHPGTSDGSQQADFVKEKEIPRRSTMTCFLKQFARRSLAALHV